MKSLSERVCLEFLRSRRGVFFTASSRQKETDALSRARARVPVKPFINSGGSKNFPLPIATSVICLLVEMACAHVYAYVCHEGSGTSGSLGGRRISVIDGAQPPASLGRSRNRRHQGDDTDGIMLLM